jgi:hypothetical protein
MFMVNLKINVGSGVNTAGVLSREDCMREIPMLSFKIAEDLSNLILRVLRRGVFKVYFGVFDDPTFNKWLVKFLLIQRYIFKVLSQFVEVTGSAKIISFGSSPHYPYLYEIMNRNNPHV